MWIVHQGRNCSSCKQIEHNVNIFEVELYGNVEKMHRAEKGLQASLSFNIFVESLSLFSTINLKLFLCHMDVVIFILYFFLHFKESIICTVCFLNSELSPLNMEVKHAD
jgi:hypothetical protein